MDFNQTVSLNVLIDLAEDFKKSVIIEKQFKALGVRYRIGDVTWESVTNEMQLWEYIELSKRLAAVYSAEFLEDRGLIKEPRLD